MLGLFSQQATGQPNAADQVDTLAKMGVQMSLIDQDSSISQLAKGTQQMFGTAPPPPKKTGVGIIDTFNDYTQ